MKRTLLMAVCLGFQISAVAGAQSAAPVAAPPLIAQTPPTPVNGDRSALATIVMRSVSELQLCRLAAAKTQNRDVRSFCRSAGNDHARTAIAGMQLAQTLGAADVKLQALPDTPAALDTLQRYSGHDFDRAFLLDQIERQEDDQEAIRYAAEVAADTSVKRYEDSILPRVEKDLHLAEGALNTISRDQP